MATGAAKHGADVTAALPPIYQNLSQSQLDQVKQRYNGNDNDPADFWKLTAYFDDQGYGVAAPIKALEFKFCYAFTDPEAHKKAVEWAEEWAAESGQPVKLPKVWGSLREYEAANPPPPDLGLIVARCGQLRNQLDTAGKDAGYEQWRAVLSILKFTKARWPDIEALTGKHIDYDQSTTEWKMGDLSAPFLCDSFSTHKDREICEGCKYRGIIRSPIALAYPREPKRKRGAV